MRRYFASLMIASCLISPIVNDIGPCDKKYSDITSEHSMCQTENATCLFHHKSNKSKEKKVLKFHNQLRNRIEISRMGTDYIATNMLKMEWDDELYKMARHHVRRCVPKPDCDLCHQTGGAHVEHNFGFTRFENESDIHEIGPTGRFIGKIKEWASTIKTTTTSDINNFELSKQTDSYWANIFRATTYKLGCDSINFEDSPNWFTEIYVCNYAPADLNSPGKLFQLGSKSCSECPEGMGCDKEFPNLCTPIVKVNTPIEDCPPAYVRLIRRQAVCTWQPSRCEEKKFLTISSDEITMHINNIRHQITRLNENLPKPTNMLKMEWDPDLADLAKEHASKCSGAADCEACSKIDKFHTKQNFLKIVKLGNEEPIDMVRFKSAIRKWMDEIRNIIPADIANYDYTKNPNENNWTNIFRATTNKVGCAGVSYKKKSIPIEEYICYFGPTNDVNTEEIYKTGDSSCSQCPPGYKCDYMFDTLCGPVSPKESYGRILWQCDFSDRMDAECASAQQCTDKLGWNTVCESNECHEQVTVMEDKKSLLFLKSITVDNDACLIFSYKKGHQIPKTTGSSTLAGVATWNNVDKYEMVILQDNTEEWALADLKIPVSSQAIQIGFIVRKNYGSEGQEVAIKDVAVVSGLCH